MREPALFNYARESHAAARTEDFVFSQLIPYIGNKRKLLDLIYQAIRRTGVSQGTFVDLFAGSGVVARLAKRLDYRVLANDWEPYALEINRCAIDCNAQPSFAELGGYEHALHTLNQSTPCAGWVTRHLCPRDDEHYDVRRDRLFFTRANGMRIDAMRERIAEWESEGKLGSLERAALLGPMLYAVSYTSNTSGVFKGFHNGWGGQTGTALYRIKSRFALRPAAFWDNGQANVTYCEDATELAERLRREKLEIFYLDPPYNQHPYGSNYHVLNSIALWDKPALSPTITGGDKAAIRTDWRTERRSKYNYRKEAGAEFARLLKTIQARWILTSYSTDGLIPLEDLLGMVCERGRTDVVLKGYKRYRVSAQRFSKKPMNVEFVLVTDAGQSGSSATKADLVAAIRDAEARVLESHPEGGTARSMRVYSQQRGLHL